MIEVFGFNTTNGGMFEIRNTTVEEIKSALKEKFPKWSDEAIERVVANQNNYKEVIHVKKEGEKKVVKRGSISKESICINGFELNPILALGQSIHAYHKHAYRVWGTDVNKFFSHPNISMKYNKFEEKYDELVVALKNRPMPNKQLITQKVIAMCDKMDDLKSAFEKSGYLQQDTDNEYISGTGRRLGIGELMTRVGELSSDCSAALR